MSHTFAYAAELDRGMNPTPGTPVLGGGTAPHPRTGAYPIPTQWGHVWADDWSASIQMEAGVPLPLTVWSPVRRGLVRPEEARRAYHEWEQDLFNRWDYSYRNGPTSCGDYSRPYAEVVEEAETCGCPSCERFLWSADWTIIQEYKYHSCRRRIETVAEDPFRSGLHTLGFEVERCFHGVGLSDREPAPEGPFWAYWETDGSCGIEGVSHAYALDDFGERRIKMDLSRSRDAFKEGDFFDPGYPLVDRRCGGHMTLCGPAARLELWRPFAGLFYSLYPKRLKSDYCSSDLTLRNGTDKYSPLHIRATGSIEFRVPTSPDRVAQVEHRFAMMRALVPVASARGSLEDALEAVEEPLRFMSRRRWEEKVKLAYAFQHFIETRETSPEIRGFMPRHY